MPTIAIPGKNKEEAEREADKMQEEILAKQYADPDFLLCRHGKRDWRGADPVCAFDEEGNFREWNWSCFLIGKVRSLMGHWADDSDSAPGHYWWDDDQNYGVLFVTSWIDRKEIDSYLMGAYVIIDWYKSRGKTDSFRILRQNIIQEGTEDDAKELVRLYKGYIDKIYVEDESSEL